MTHGGDNIWKLLGYKENIQYGCNFSPLLNVRIRKDKLKSQYLKIMYMLYIYIYDFRIN